MYYSMKAVLIIRNGQYLINRIAFDLWNSIKHFSSRGYSKYRIKHLIVIDELDNPIHNSRLKRVEP